jgi:hypothetical protein
MVADFVICRPDFSALAVVELARPGRSGEARRRRLSQMEAALRAAGIKVLQLAPRDIPSEPALRALIAALPAHGPASLMRRAS